MTTWMIVPFLLCLCIVTHSVPIAKRIVDMSYVFDNTTLHWPTAKKYEMKFLFNDTMGTGNWFQTEEFSSSTHTGTHMDAPCHGAKGRWGIDEIPISRLVAPAAVIDIRGKAKLDPDAEVEIEDLQKWENQTGQTLDGTIILMLSGWGKRYSNRTAYVAMDTWMIAPFLLCLSIISQSAPIAKQMVDMTYVFDDASLYFPGYKKFEIQVFSNVSIGNGIWFQHEEYSSTTHAGTHMDAPSHLSMGRWNIDDIPISRFVAPAAVIDIRAKTDLDPDAEVEIEDLQKWENETGQTLDETIILMLSGWGKRYSNRTAYVGTSGAEDLHFPGVAPTAAQWLVDNRRVYGVGTDTLSLDHGRSSQFLTHRTLFDANIFGLENVANVDKIPMYGAKLYVMPMKIAGASGAPTRIIATFPLVIFGDTSDATE